MCLAIYAVEDHQLLEIEFALERILQRRQGTTDFCVDVLLRNASPEPVRRFRVILPHALADPASLQSPLKKLNVQKSLKRLREKALRNAVVETIPFGNPSDYSHWIYTLLPNIAIDHRTCGNGKFSIERAGGPPLNGFIKQGWEITYPDEFLQSEWLWYLFTANEITILEVGMRRDTPNREALMGNESMWLRLQFRIPAYNFNKKSLVQRVFARNLEYIQSFQSAAAIVSHVKTRIDQFDQLIQRLGTAQAEWRVAASRKDSLLPVTATVAEEKDWRAFFYREYGVSVVEVNQRGDEPGNPDRICVYTLPWYSHPRGVRRGIWPACLNWWFRKDRTTPCLEYWIGSTHQRSSSRGYIAEIWMRSENVKYNYLAWLGFIGFILGVLGFMKNFGILQWLEQYLWR